MSAAGRSGASIFAQRPATAGSARGDPVPANEDTQRRFPTWSLSLQLSQQLRLHEGQVKASWRRRLRPQAAQPLFLPPRREQQRSGPGTVPGTPQLRSGRSRTVRPSLPALLGLGTTWYLRGAAPLCWAPRPRPTSSPAPASYVPAPASCFPTPACQPLQVLRRCLPLHRPSSRWQRRRVRSLLPSQHVPTRGCVTRRHVPGQRRSASSVPPECAGRGTRVPPWGLVRAQQPPGAPLAGRVF